MGLRRRLLLAETDYITSGLVFWLDGKNRGGVSGQWKDIIGGKIATLSGGYTESTDYVSFDGVDGKGLFNEGLLIDKDVGTIEIAVELTASEATGRPTVSFGNGYIGGSIASLTTDAGPGFRYYDYDGSMTFWRFPATINSLKLLAGGNALRGICNGQDGTSSSITSWSHAGADPLVGYRGSGNYFKGKMYSIRIYNRQLTKNEILHNQRLDNKRYNLGLTI